MTNANRTFAQFLMTFYRVDYSELMDCERVALWNDLEPAFKRWVNA